MNEKRPPPHFKNVRHAAYIFIPHTLVRTLACICWDACAPRVPFARSPLPALVTCVFYPYYYYCYGCRYYCCYFILFFFEATALPFFFTFLSSAMPLACYWRAADMLLTCQCFSPNGNKLHLPLQMNYYANVPLRMCVQARHAARLLPCCNGAAYMCLRPYVHTRIYVPARASAHINAQTQQHISRITSHKKKNA